MREVPLESAQAHIPSPDFSAREMAKAVAQGQILLPERKKSLMALD